MNYQIQDTKEVLNSLIGPNDIGLSNMCLLVELSLMGE